MSLNCRHVFLFVFTWTFIIVISNVIRTVSSKDVTSLQKTGSSKNLKNLPLIKKTLSGILDVLLALDTDNILHDSLKADVQCCEFVRTATKAIIEDIEAMKTDYITLGKWTKQLNTTLNDIVLNKGIQGAKGDKGDTGQSGKDGLSGIAGPPGIPGGVGPRGPPGQVGAKGEFGLMGQKGEKGECVDKQGKVNYNMNGIKGEMGPPGIPGRKGVPGGRGPRGIKGEKGDRGLRAKSNNDPTGRRGNR